MFVRRISMSCRLQHALFSKLTRYVFSDLWDWGLALSFILLYYPTTKYKNKVYSVIEKTKQDTLSIAVKLIHMPYQRVAILNDVLWVQRWLVLFFKRKVLLCFEESIRKRSCLVLGFLFLYYYQKTFWFLDLYQGYYKSTFF